MTAPFIPQHVERNGAISIPGPLEQVFPLFTALGEKHWAQGWDPTFCYPVDGQPEVGAVFLTSHADEPATVWVMTQYAPDSGEISYARFTTDVAAGTVTVCCTAVAPNATTVQVMYRMTALSATGNDYLTTFAPDHDPHWLHAWETAIRLYLQG